MPSQDQVSATRVIAAAPEAIFAVLTDPTKHPVIDGSGTVRSTKGDATRLALGETFGMSLHNKVGYSTKPKVVELEENRRIAWRNNGGPTWRYELTPQGDSTLVVETYDLSTMRGGSLLKHTRLPKHTQANMTKTLERLDRFVTTGVADAAT